MATCTVYGQNFVTDSRTEITDHLDSLNMDYTIAMATNGSEYLHFMDGEITVQYQFNEEDICVAYIMLFPEAGLEESIKGLDATFQRINDKQWREFDGQQYFSWTLDRKYDGYRISVVTEVFLNNKH